MKINQALTILLRCGDIRSQRRKHLANGEPADIVCYYSCAILYSEDMNDHMRYYSDYGHSELANLPFTPSITPPR